MGRGLRIGLLMCIGASLACGSDGDGGGGKSSGVSGQKTVSELSDDEARALCEWASSQVGESSFEPTKEQGCTLFAASFSETKAECEEFRKACIEAPEEDDQDAPPAEEEPEEDECADAMVGDRAEGCTVTVGEYERCVKDTVSALRDVFASISCDDVGMTSFEDSADEHEPESCKALEAKCPELFTDDESEEASSEG